MSAVWGTRGRPVLVLLVASEVCESSGHPVCPRCGFECAKCRCCERFNCPACGAYVALPKSAGRAVRHDVSDG